jgi:hypothetical protein
VSAGVAQSVADLGVTVRRVAGATRYATSVALLSRSAEAGLSPGRPWVVTGRDWPDALAAGPAAARDGDALLLVDGTDLDRSRAAQRWLLRSWPKERATLVGGTSAVGRGTERDLAALIADRARTGTRVAAAGDIACDPRDAKWGAHDACRQADTAELAGRAQAVLALGDLQYARATSANFAASYDPTWGRFKGVTHPALGSHEYAAGSRAADYHAYFDGRVGEPGRAYYETTLGGWQVLSLDSNCHEHDGCGDGSAMQRWLERRLADSAASCQLAMMHHPPFSSGSVHGSHPHLRPLLETLQAGGVDVLLTSHAHSYERLRRATPAGAPDPDRGIRSFVVGTGGKDLRALSPSPHPLTAIRTHQHFGVLELDLRPTSYRWEFQPLADSGHGGGSFTDVGFGSCR